MGSAIVVKQIKATKINQSIFNAEFVAGMVETATEMEREFKKTTASWKTQVDFEKIIDTTGGSMAVLVGTDNEIYGYVDEGTEPHVIRPVNAPALAFIWGGKGSYRSATIPKWIGSRPASVSGTLHRTKEVHHPGTVARRFSQTIQDWEQPRYKKRMEKRLHSAVQKSGHQMK
jgi:hypothetical protein